MSEKITWSADFAPSYTPPEMLAMGCFEGKYVNNIKGVPASWKVKGKVLSKTDKPDATVNYYGVKSRMPLSHWKEKGWIKTDKNGWFEWYIHYFLGRRLGEEDTWQINRWKSFVARHNAQVHLKCKVGDKSCNTAQRQALLQFGWDSDKKFTDEEKAKNLKKLKSTTGIAVESFEPSADKPAAHKPKFSEW